jgi:tRNA U34 5-methylaminomethyl-2-thiouridine-forming methyltransferase MnmC
VGRKIVTTADGSSSIYVSGLDEHYHSIYGAVQESEYVFIKSGLFSENLKSLDKISILEIGFGTGLNALLTYFFALETQQQIHYTTIEPYPLSSEEIQGTPNN